jgi:hypothetical protein
MDFVEPGYAASPAAGGARPEACACTLVQGVYDPECFPRLDNDAKEAAEGILNVSFPPSRGANQRHIGDIPGGISWDGPHKGKGFDPMPNKEEWKVL